MDEAYTVGIRLALDDGISAGIASISGDLATLDRAIAATTGSLQQLAAFAGTATHAAAADVQLLARQGSEALRTPRQSADAAPSPAPPAASVPLVGLSAPPPAVATEPEAPVRIETRRSFPTTQSPPPPPPPAPMQAPSAPLTPVVRLLPATPPSIVPPPAATASIPLATGMAAPAAARAPGTPWLPRVEQNFVNHEAPSTTFPLAPIAAAPVAPSSVAPEAAAPSLAPSLAPSMQSVAPPPSP